MWPDGVGSRQGGIAEVGVEKSQKPRKADSSLFLLLVFYSSGIDVYSPGGFFLKTKHPGFFLVFLVFVLGRVIQSPGLD